MIGVEQLERGLGELIRRLGWQGLLDELPEPERARIEERALWEERSYPRHNLVLLGNGFTAQAFIPRQKSKVAELQSLGSFESVAAVE